MARLNKWIEFGRAPHQYGQGRKVRRWLNEARGRTPIIDRVNFPDTGRDRREFPRPGAGEY